jgi:ABC-type Fe3+-hydroxamate transport system substrate-binding protein
LGHVVSREKQADYLVAQLEQKVRFLEHERASESIQSYYVEVDHPNWTLGNQDFLVDSLKRLRLENIFSDVHQLSAQVSNELIVERKPDLIFSFREGRHDFRTRPGWQSIPAVVNHHIYDQLNGDNCSRPGPYLIDCLQEIVKVIHEK